jgi:hypothetical protein
MKRSEQIRLIEEKIKAVKDLSYDNLTAQIRKADLEPILKRAAELEASAIDYSKKADKVEEVTKANADYLISSTMLYGVKSYGFDYVKMYGKEIGLVVATIVGVQLLTNPEFVFSTIGSVFSGVTGAIGSYTSYFVNSSKSAPKVEPVVDLKRNITVDVPVNKNNTDNLGNATIPGKFENTIDLDVKINATEPTYITHDGMYWLVTPYHSGTMSE